jgi:L-threonylcarbamoyladenylate synthase
MNPSPKPAIARIIKISSKKIEEGKVRSIARVLRDGEVIVYPTDTFYGLGGDCFSVQALQRIYRIKKRVPRRPFPVLISDVHMVKDLATEVPVALKALAARFWPGPLTLVLRAAAGFPAELVGANRTIGIRLPNVAWLRELIRRVGFPIIATSANISGAGEIDSAEEVIRQFQDKVDLIVDGGRTPGGRPSTVVDLTGETPVFLREGAISKEEIQSFLF